MPRAYTVATAALALDVPPKWVDNILSHHNVPGVAQHRQGVARKLTVDGLLVLALTTFLIHELGAPMLKAVGIAEELRRNEGRYESPRGLSLMLNLSAFRTNLLERLENAVEMAPAPRRGRPAANKTGRLD
jgi:dienelactone hydrolase